MNTIPACATQCIVTLRGRIWAHMPAVRSMVRAPRTTGEAAVKGWLRVAAAAGAAAATKKAAAAEGARATAEAGAEAEATAEEGSGRAAEGTAGLGEGG